MVFESFGAAAVADPVTVSANVSVFVPRASCEIAWPTTRLLGSVFMLVQLDSDICSEGAEHQDRIYVNTNNDSCTDDCMSFVTYNLWRVNRSTTQDSSSASPLDVNTPYNFWFALLVGNMSLEPLACDDHGGQEIRKPVLRQAASVVCSVDYTMHKSTVLYNNTGNQFSIDHMHLLPNFDDLTGTTLEEMIFTALAGSTGLALDEYGDNAFLGAADPTQFIMLQTLNETRSMDRLLSEETFNVVSQSSLGWNCGSLYAREFLDTRENQYQRHNKSHGESPTSWGACCCLAHGSRRGSDHRIHCHHHAYHASRCYTHRPRLFVVRCHHSGGKSEPRKPSLAFRSHAYKSAHSHTAKIQIRCADQQSARDPGH